MRGSKKTVSMIMAAILAIGLTGCMRMDTVIDTTGSSKHYTVETTTLYNKEAIDSMSAGEDTGTTTANSAGTTAANTAGAGSANSDSADDIQKLPVVTVDGKQYYQDKVEKETHPYTKGKPVDGMIVTDSSFYADNSIAGENPDDLEEAIASGMVEQINLKVLFDSKIEKTNGKLDKNKKGVTFSFKFGDSKKVNKNKLFGEMYAYTDKAESSLSDDRAVMKEYNTKQKSAGKKKAVTKSNKNKSKSKK